MKAARITFNSLNFVRPSGMGGKSTNVGAFEYQNGFGFDEWLNYQSYPNDEAYRKFITRLGYPGGHEFLKFTKREDLIPYVDENGNMAHFTYVVALDSYTNKQLIQRQRIENNDLILYTIIRLNGNTTKRFVVKILRKGTWKIVDQPRYRALSGIAQNQNRFSQMREELTECFNPSPPKLMRQALHSGTALSAFNEQREDINKQLFNLQIIDDSESLSLDLKEITENGPYAQILKYPRFKPLYTL